MAENAENTNGAELAIDVDSDLDMSDTELQTTIITPQLEPSPLWIAPLGTDIDGDAGNSKIGTEPASSETSSPIESTAVTVPVQADIQASSQSDATSPFEPALLTVTTSPVPTLVSSVSPSASSLPVFSPTNGASIPMQDSASPMQPTLSIASSSSSNQPTLPKMSAHLPARPIASTPSHAVKVPVPPLTRSAQLLQRIEQEPEDGEAWLALVADAESKGDLEGTREVYEQFLKIFPDSVRYPFLWQYIKYVPYWLLFTLPFRPSNG